ncbi:MAG: hypothetical protein HYY65_07975 [Candidatus Tectomicrobia bacterium]|uniref:Uncharacterized protein n=1 Tax=Tectimicrobiota bacterium TaxID=2528274 RepID=A0A932GPK8_UNCTE|nr:hypothetical protein [Candidatus Tectomicrobia bacterium]
MPAQGHLYFHSPCFDGIVSAVLAWDFLEAGQGWASITLHRVNYDLRETWLTSSLESPCAVVDFLYHPQAQFWADHHMTAFLNEESRQHFENRRGPALVYDERAGSCSGLLREHLSRAFGHRNPRYDEMVQWAEKIDAARYESVREAILAPAPALRISTGLALGGAEGYCEGLVRSLRNGTLQEVADLPEVQGRFERAQARMQTGLDRFAAAARLESDGIVVFDVDGKGALISRYAPYYFFPEARYSAGIVRWEDGAGITAMRNPWREFESVFLGKICEKLGGGGHQRVGSVVLRGDRAAEAASVLERLLSEIRYAESRGGGGQTP